MTALEPRAHAQPRRQGLDGVQLHIVDRFSELEACRRWAGQRRDGPLFFDTESGGLNPHRDAHRMTQLGDLEHGWAFPGGWLGAASEILRDYEGELGAHNLPYDWRVLNVHEGLELPWHRCQDTLLTCHITDSTRVAALKPRAALDVDPRAVAGDQLLHDAMAAQGWTWATVPYGYKPYSLYGAIDPVLAAHLWDRHSPEVLGSFARSYELERATARVCAGMMSAGMMIDRGYINEKITGMLVFYDQAMAWFRSRFGLTSINSEGQVERLLNSVGVPTLVRTKTGQASIAKDTLRVYAHMYPEQAEIIRAVAWCRKTDAVVNRYLRKFLALADAGDIMHYQIWTSQARTGRMSITDPPMQTYDRDEPAVRGAYVPRPGHVFVSIDADQIEARLAAVFSGDRNMIGDFLEADATGASFFVLGASRIFAEEISKKDPRYTRTKNATYGQIYGAGLDKAAKTAGVPVSVMHPVYAGIQARYPGLARLMNEIIRRLKSGRGRPFITTLAGRRLYVDRGHEYAGLNTMIQGSAAEILKWNTVKLDAAGYGSAMRLLVHDEFLLEVPIEDAKDVLHDVSELLTDRTSFPVPITWSGSILRDRWRKT